MCIFNTRWIVASALACVLLMLCAQTTQATWSVVLTNRVTGEIAVGQATCLSNRDLRAGSTAVRVLKGAGVVQNSGDPDGSRRMLINDGLINGDSPDVILDGLSGIGGHNTRQYGICDTIGRTVSFSGNGGRNFNGGLIGNNGDLAYAIQGNSLAGQCVILAMRDAVLAVENHDIPQKLMAAMEAARASGGDGRCSCDKGPNKCGCPVASFTKSAHVGFMLVTRLGDTNDPVCDVDGCADGNYFMTFDVTSGGADTDDPVFQLQTMFDIRRAGLVGQPDAIQSSVIITPDTTTATDDDFVMTIELNDWQPLPIPAAVSTLTVVHEDGDTISTIDAPSTTGGGIYTVALTNVSSGTERFRVTADGVVLAPFSELTVGGGGDADGDGFEVPADCDDTNPAVNPGADEICDDGVDNDCDGLIDGVDPDCLGGPGCGLKNESCSANSDCCSGKCRNGKCVGSPATTSLFFEPRPSAILALAANNVSPLTCSVPATIFN